MHCGAAASEQIEGSDRAEGGRGALRCAGLMSDDDGYGDEWRRRRSGDGDGMGGYVEEHGYASQRGAAAGDRAAPSSVVKSWWRSPGPVSRAATEYFEHATDDRAEDGALARGVEAWMEASGVTPAASSHARDASGSARSSPPRTARSGADGHWGSHTSVLRSGGSLAGGSVRRRWSGQRGTSEETDGSGALVTPDAGSAADQRAARNGTLTVLHSRCNKLQLQSERAMESLQRARERSDRLRTECEDLAARNAQLEDLVVQLQTGSGATRVDGEERQATGAFGFIRGLWESLVPAQRGDDSARRETSVASACCTLLVVAGLLIILWLVLQWVGWVVAGGRRYGPGGGYPRVVVAPTPCD